MLKWRVYYSDGTTSEDTKPPPRDVQAILQKDEEGRWIVRSGGDFYVLEDGVWVERNGIFSLFDYIMDTGLVLFGRTVSNEKYGAVMAQAMKDREQLP